MSTEFPEIMDVKQVAAYIGVHFQTIYNWCAELRIPHSKLNGVRRFVKKDVDAWIEKRKVKTKVF